MGKSFQFDYSAGISNSLSALKLLMVALAVHIDQVCSGEFVCMKTTLGGNFGCMKTTVDTFCCRNLKMSLFIYPLTTFGES